MKTKNVLSFIIGAVLLLSSGVLFAFQHEEGNGLEKPRKMKITIVKDNNGSLQKTEEIIEVKSKEDVKNYLKSKGVKLSELNFYGKSGAHHHRAPFANMWIYNVSGKPIGESTQTMFIKRDVNIEDNNIGEKTEKLVVKTIEMKTSDNTQNQEVKIEKIVAKDGNIVIRKWVNGKEVDPNSKVETRQVFMEEGNGEMVMKLAGEDGDYEKVIKIKKEVDKDGNVTIMKSVNGGDFKKVEGEKFGKHGCKKGVHKYCKDPKGFAHYGGHGARGFAARSNDGSILVFGVPVNENGNEISKKSISEEGDKQLEIEDVSFYPNPTENQFSISFKSAEKGKISIQVKDMQGKEVLNEEFDHEGGEFKQELELKNAEAGMYIFNVLQNGKTFTHKLLVR